MSDYKTAKEAFVADNLGSSLYTILAVSVVAWTSYALYATIAPRFRPSFLLDYLTSALPLLLSVTLFATAPLTLNFIIVILSLLFYSTSPVLRRKQIAPRKKKSLGSWLDESDSDEEPAQPPSAAASAQGTPIKLPSQVAFTSASALSPGDSPSLNGSGSASAATSPSSLSVDDPFNSGSGPSKINKRRLSPQPSPEPHTVNIMSTPPFSEIDSLISPNKTYPSPSATAASRRDIVDAASLSYARQHKGRLPFLSIYRAHMMLLTVICILAVDFPVFPRWLGKCEDFGTSLMDVGVGSFVFSLGLISVKSLTATSRSSSVSPNIKSRSLSSEVLQALRKSSPVLALGLVRVMMVKGTEYPEHVTEYGVHWNFFFTIGLLPVFGVLVRPLRAWVQWSVLGVAISLAQQIILSHLHLQAFLLSPARPGLLGANKEGLASLPGYISIYLIGLATGEHVARLSAPPPPPSQAQNRGVGVVSQSAEEHRKNHYAKRRMELTLELFGYTVAWWTALIGWRIAGGEVSRRFANTPYVLFIASYNTLFLLGYLLLETYLPPHPTPPLLEAINKNGLAVFLVANLGTGLVNLSMKTMYASTSVGMLVLGLYCAGVSGVAWVLRGRRIKI